MDGKREEIVDKIRFQWFQYQLDMYLKPPEEVSKSFVKQPSNWAYALQRVWSHSTH